MTTKALVTGGAGFIGSHLVDKLLRDGMTVTVLDNLASGKREHLEEACKTGRLQMVEGSVLNDHDLDAAMKGCEIVFHLAVECVRKSIGQPLDNHEVNATGTLRTLDAARRAKISRFVYCSSSDVYGNSSQGRLSETTMCAPTTVYGAAKLAGEHYALAYLRMYGLPTVIVRPFNAYGPRAHDEGDLAEVVPRFVIRMMNGLPPIIFGDGQSARDFTYVSDTAQGLALAAQRDGAVGEIVNLAFGHPIPVIEVASTIARELRCNHLSPERRPARPGDIERLAADTERCTRLLGFTPRVPFAEGIARYVQWFRARHPDPLRTAEAGVENWTLPE